MSQKAIIIQSAGYSFPDDLNSAEQEALDSVTREQYERQPFASRSEEILFVAQALAAAGFLIEDGDGTLMLATFGLL